MIPWASRLSEDAGPASKLVLHNLFLKACSVGFVRTSCTLFAEMMVAGYASWFQTEGAARSEPAAG